MIKETIFLVALIFPPVAAGIPAIVAVPAALTVAVPVDRAVNTITGGTPNKTISGDTARARKEGSKYAKFKCGTYNLVAPYDYLYFTPEEIKYMEAKGAKDHCARWAMYEAGELKDVPKRDHSRDYDGLNR